ncbi:hypothetical protein ACFSO7_20840 [Bacillus sp. CGMCC 1.16607]|uniref:hypothetical protein n=1 Tax=Bacillus sp. CGMCC 1.16607 TaxID=3351842 RepID=UPI00362F855B
MNITINIQAPELANAILSLASAFTGNIPINFAEAPVVQPTVPAQQIQQVTPTQQIQPVPQQQVMPTAVPTAPIQQPPVTQPMQQQYQQQPAQPVPTSAPTYTLDQLAVAATQLMDAGRQPELLSLLASFGVQSLMQLPQEQYGAFATKLRELGVNI